MKPKRILAALLAVVMVIVMIVPVNVVAETDPVLEFAIVTYPVLEGDTTLSADLTVTLPEDATGYELGTFALDMSYDSAIMTLAKNPEWHVGGTHISNGDITANPYMIFWISVRVEEQFKAGTTVVATLTFYLNTPAVSGAEYDIDIEINEDNGIASMGSKDGTFDEIIYSAEQISLISECVVAQANDSSDTGDDTETPSYSNDENVYIDEKFTSKELFLNNFILGAFEFGDNYLYGYDEAKILQSIHGSDDNGFCDNTGNTWRTYDASITLKIADDDLSDSNRFVNLVYRNDNPAYLGFADETIFMSFTYDIQERCFRFAPGWNNTNAEEQYLDPVYMELNTDGNEEITLSISVDTDRIRCFCNNTLIFDYTNTELYIADTINSPFVFWQDGNYVQISNVKVTKQGYMFPYDDLYDEIPESSDFVIEGGVLIEYTGNGGDVVIPDSVTSIGDGAFESCSSLTSITIPDGVTCIGDWTFRNCYNLKSVTIPNSVTYIGYYAFSDCYDLTSITIPNSVTTIGREAFWGCGSLTSITIPDSVANIGFSAFEHTEYYYDESNWENGVLYIDNHLIDAKKTIGGAYTVKYGTITIADRAFNDCGSLTGITISASVTTIGDSVFDGCTSLAEISVSENNAAYKSIDGVLFSKDVKTLIRYPIGRTNTEYTVSDSVATIGNGAFSGCTYLKSITFGDNLTTISNSAFSSCTNLTSITFGDGLTTISNNAFKSCSSLMSITIPDGVAYIGDSVFTFCKSLVNITIPDSVTYLGSSFYDTAYYNDESNWQNGVLYIDNHLIDAKASLFNEYTKYIIKDGTVTIEQVQ